MSVNKEDGIIQISQTSNYQEELEYLLRKTAKAQRLVAVVKELSLARDIDRVIEIVRLAARELTGADGATFVLREGDQCYYAEENAIAPLWKGKRFPMEACISGWAMKHGKVAVIPDIYVDPRIPQDAYRPTFVKSLAMVPIRSEAPIGAIGNYWADYHEATDDEIALLQSLADTTSVALENIQLYEQLERRVQERTIQLEAANKELEAFSYSVSHDLRAPLRTIDGFSQAVLDNYADQLDEKGKSYLNRIRQGCQQMAQLIDDMLNLSRVTRGELNIQDNVNLSMLAREVATELQKQQPDRNVRFDITDGIIVCGDRRLLQVLLQNLIGNAWKFTSKNESACIEFKSMQQDGNQVFYVKDNGAGFDMAYAGKLFGAFQRLHTETEFPGTGVGLATVARIIHRHGGQVWAEGAVGQGATFYFTLEPHTLKH